MKKILSVMLTVLLTVCLTVTAFADDKPQLTVSDAYQKLDVDGVSYSLFNINSIEYLYIDEWDYADSTVHTKTEEGSSVYAVSVRNNVQRTVIRIVYDFDSGVQLTLHYLRDDCREEFNDLIDGKTDRYVIALRSWSDDKDVTANKTALFGETVSLSASDTYNSDYYDVTARSTDGTLRVLKGTLLFLDNAYYYVDYAETDMEMPYDFSALSGIPTFPAYRITDSALLNSLNDELGSSIDYEALYEDDLSDKISVVFFVFLFGILPLAVFVTFLILMLRQKGVYRKLFGAVCILSAAELSVFATITALILLLG